MTVDPRRYDDGPFHIDDYPLLRMAQIIEATQELIVSDVRSYKLTPSSWRAIALLAEQEGMTVKSLAKGAVLERSAMSRVIDRLERDGFVNRNPHPQDKRSSTIKLSRKGHELYRQYRPLALSAMRTAFHNIGPSDMGRLFRLLDRVIRNLGIPEAADETRTARN